jgi:ribonucleotide reductase alpha subunit
LNQRDWSDFAYRIYKMKYSMDGKEEWADTVRRVVDSVCGAVPAIPQHTRELIYQMILERKFLPGGRYLYAAGRTFHQIANCALFRAEDSREGWADLIHKATMALMTGAGIGVDFSDVRASGQIVRRTGGTATGPLSLALMLNEIGRHVMQGGARRSAQFGALRWDHPDVLKWIKAKEWSPEIRRMKEMDFNAWAPLDGMNISVILDKRFFDAYTAGDAFARLVYHDTIEHMMRTGEPGLSINYVNPRESLRNAPVAGETRVLTDEGYQEVRQIVGRPVTVWTGKRWAPDVVFRLTNPDAALVRVALSNGRAIICDPEHPFMVRVYKWVGKQKNINITRVPAKNLITDDKIASDLPSIWGDNHGTQKDYGLGFVFGDGSIRNGRGDISVHTENKRTSFERAVAGLNAHYGSFKNRAYFKAEVNTKEALLQKPLSAQFIAGWFDADGCYIRKTLRISNRSKADLLVLQENLDRLGIKSIVRKDGESTYCPGNTMYTLGVLASSLVDFRLRIPTTRIAIDVPESYKSYRESEIRVVSVESLERRAPVYCCDVGFEEHSFMAEGVLVSNCTEVVSEDDSDICNLGSLNLGRIQSLEEMQQCVELATIFLLAGTVYSDVPFAKIERVRDKNRRLGLGLMGVHEWLLKRGKKYGPDAELGTWLEAYREVSNRTAALTAGAWNLNTPVAVRAIAPTGTIGIIAETTGGIEPIFCVAYRRRYRAQDGVRTQYEYVIDPVAQRLITAGVSPDLVEDAYTLADDLERRVAFQAWMQQYVDNAISSTLNLPPWGSPQNNETTVAAFGDMLLKYLPDLRGITAYPDGARDGQPLVRVPYEEAKQHVGQVYYEQTDVCVISGKGGTCGS